MKITEIHTHHKSVNLRLFEQKKNIGGIFTDEHGHTLNNSEAREYVKECRAKGWNKLPLCKDGECPDFDHVEHGCNGHFKAIEIEGVRYVPALAPLNDSSPCEYCHLYELCNSKERATERLKDICGKYLSENQYFSR